MQRTPRLRLGCIAGVIGAGSLIRRVRPTCAYWMIVKPILYFLGFVAIALWITIRWFVRPARLIARASYDPVGGCIRCVLHLARAKRHAQVWEITMSRHWVEAAGASPPTAFAEEPLKEHLERDVETFNREMVRWVGSLSVPPNQDVVLCIPTKHVDIAGSKIWFEWSYTEKMATFTKSCETTVESGLGNVAA